MSASHVPHCILTICIHHVIKLCQIHTVYVTFNVNKPFVYQKTQDRFLFSILCGAGERTSAARKLCSWCVTCLVGLGECVFVSVLLSLAQVSRMFNYTLCHFSGAERGFVMAGLVCFLHSLTAVQCFSFFSALCSNLLQPYDPVFSFFESNGQTLTLQTLWKMQHRSSFINF